MDLLFNFLIHAYIALALKLGNRGVWILIGFFLTFVVVGLLSRWAGVSGWLSAVLTVIGMAGLIFGVIAAIRWDDDE